MGLRLPRRTALKDSSDTSVALYIDFCRHRRVGSGDLGGIM